MFELMERGDLMAPSPSGRWRLMHDEEMRKRVFWESGRVISAERRRGLRRSENTADGGEEKLLPRSRLRKIKDE